MRSAVMELELLKLLQNRSSKHNIEKVLKLLGADITLLPDFMKLFNEGDKKVVNNCAWVLSHLGERNASVLKPYMSDLVKRLENKTGTDAVKRGITRALSFAKIPDEWLGPCYDACYTLFLDRSEAIAVRVFSLRVLQNIAVKNPDLLEELFASIELELSHPVSKGFRNRAEKVLKGKF